VRDFLVSECKRFGIEVTGYSPLGSGKQGPLQDPHITQLAQKYSKTPAQIILRWIIQKGITVVPKSANEKRLAENIDIFDFSISQEDMQSINALNQNKCYLDQVETWGYPIFE